VCIHSNLRFWDIYNPEVPCQVASVTNALCCRYSPDGTTLAVGCVMHYLSYNFFVSACCICYRSELTLLLLLLEDENGSRGPYMFVHPIVTESHDVD